MALPAIFATEHPALRPAHAISCSAVILLATTLQDHGLPTLVGDPAGGHANQTGNMALVRLAHAGFEAGIPARLFVRPNGDARPGPLLPDRTLPRATGRDDPPLCAALDILRIRP
jgi:hypothetical protein